MKNYLIFCLILVNSVGCAFLDRRDFYAQMDPMYDNDPLFVPNRDFQVVPGDSGRYYRGEDDILGRTPATAQMSKQDRYQRSLAQEVVRLENRLNDAEFQEYTKYRDKLGTDSERIYYLGLSSEQKREYLELRNIETPRYYSIADTYNKSSPREIMMGMRKSEVLQSWGEPVRREQSGDPRLQNERWAYRRHGRMKYIYFEDGVVGGWTEQ
jgi:hypothetical protein